MPIRCRTSPLLPPEELIMLPRQTKPLTILTCPSATWTVEQRMDDGTRSFLVFDQFIRRPKTAASSSIIIIARTSTSSISASSVTSSTKSRSVNTSFPKVTSAIPRCALRSIIWSIGPRNKSGVILPAATTYCKPIRQHAISTDTTICVRLQGFYEVHNFTVQTKAA